MRLKLMALAIVAVVAGVPALAGDNYPCEKGSHCTSKQCSNCPKCGNVCYPTVKEGKEKKHCWEVKTKTICIPKVRFPWEKSCSDSCCDKQCEQPKCGRTKCVRVLMKCEYECPKCKYSWDPVPCGCEKGGCDIAPPAPARDTPPAEEARRRIRPPEAKVVYGYEDRI